MSEWVPLAMRAAVQQRAGHRCEYCLLHEDDAGASHEPDHIIAGRLVRLFNPRVDIWAEHFQLDGAVIRPLTPEG